MRVLAAITLLLSALVPPPQQLRGGVALEAALALHQEQGEVRESGKKDLKAMENFSCTSGGQSPLLVRVGLGACRRRRRVAARRRRRDEERRREQRRCRRGAEETDFLERDAALSGAEREKGPGAGIGPGPLRRRREGRRRRRVEGHARRQGRQSALLSDVGFKPIRRSPTSTAPASGRRC